MTEALTNVSEIKRRVISEFNNSTSSISIAMAYFTDREIAMSLIEASKRGVKIDIILSSSDQNEIVTLMLKGGNIPVEIFNTKNRGSMHHKLCLIDNHISINGSFNFTYNASNRNNEGIIITDESGVYKTFKDEFDNLIYILKNNITSDMENTNDNNSIISNSYINSNDSIANFDAFAEQLQDLVFSSTKISSDEYKIEGYERSKECLGNVEIYGVEFGNIKEKIKVLATNDSLSSTKNLLLSNISNAFESKKSIIEIEKQKELDNATSFNSLRIEQIQNSNDELIESKSKLELGNTATNDKGIVQINLEIEKNKSEKKSLEQTFITTDFWSWGTSLKLVLLLIFSFYLSVFFSSAMFKLFFEVDEIRQIQRLGGTPEIPKIVDANAILKIFENEGTIFGIVALLFFLIPILFSNLELLGSKNKWMNKISFWVGLVLFDILVSSMVTVNTIKMTELLKGNINPEINFADVVFRSEFLLIFVFGMIPLIITHFIIEAIVQAYNNSKREFVDAEKHRKIQFLETEMLELLSLKETTQSGIVNLENLIKENKDKISNLETEIKTKKESIEKRFDVLLNQYHTIYDEFRSKIISGKIFTEVIFDSAISAYKSGFIEYLQERYSDTEIKNRINLIEQIK